MKVIKIRITMSDGRVHGTTENFDYEPIATTQDTFDEAIKHISVLINHELELNNDKREVSLKFIYENQLK